MVIPGLMLLSLWSNYSILLCVRLIVCERPRCRDNGGLLDARGSRSLKEQMIIQIHFLYRYSWSFYVTLTLAFPEELVLAIISVALDHCFPSPFLQISLIHHMAIILTFKIHIWFQDYNGSHVWCKYHFFSLSSARISWMLHPSMLPFFLVSPSRSSPLFNPPMAPILRPMLSAQLC